MLQLAVMQFIEDLEDEMKKKIENERKRKEQLHTRESNFSVPTS